MSLTGANLAVLERSPNLYLFVSVGGGLHRFEGRFRALDHEDVRTTTSGRRPPSSGSSYSSTTPQSQVSGTDLKLADSHASSSRHAATCASPADSR